MPIRIRRVVTGHNSKGESTFLMDGLAPNVKEMASMPGVALTDLWETTTAPANNTGSADAAERPVKLEPPEVGSILRIVEFPPDSMWKGADAAKAFESIGAGHAPDKTSDDPMRHKTSTIDYIIISSIPLKVDTSIGCNCCCRGCCGVIILNNPHLCLTLLRNRQFH